MIKAELSKNPSSKTLLCALLSVLRSVAGLSATNRMCSKNLAICIDPSLISAFSSDLLKSLCANIVQVSNSHRRPSPDPLLVFNRACT